MPGHPRDPRVDAYIEKSEEFAKPILAHLREVVHSACPEVEETIKWQFPNFMYKGMLCSMAAFKEHAVFGFWKREPVTGVPAKKSASDTSMGQFGRLTKVSDLPPDAVLKAYVRKAMALNEAGVTVPRVSKPKAPLKVPGDLARALHSRKKAWKAFEGFSPSHRREYVEWIESAKREETRARRIEKALAMIEQGKPRNWKYE